MSLQIDYQPRTTLFRASLRFLRGPLIGAAALAIAALIYLRQEVTQRVFDHFYVSACLAQSFDPSRQYGGEGLGSDSTGRLNVYAGGDAPLYNTNFEAWNKLAKSVEETPLGAVWMGGLQWPGGDQVLVVIQYVSADFVYATVVGHSGDKLDRWATILRSGTVDWPLEPIYARKVDEVIKVYGGSVDPVDPSRVLVPVTIGEQAYTLTGELQRNYTLRFQLEKL